MAWEWVSPVSAAGGALLGSALTAVTAWGGWRHAERLAKQNRFGEGQTKAYVELLTMTEQTVAWGEAVKPVIDIGQGVPDLASIEAQVRVRALLNAYASDEVKELFENFIKSTKDILSKVRQIEQRQARQDAGHPVASSESYLVPWGELEDASRPALKEAQQKLAEQVQSELRAQTR